MLGRYKLLEELGVGGMAVVHRAEDPALRRDVAIKVLHAHLLRKKDHRARFLREARAAASLDHPGILRIFDVVGSADDAGGADGGGPTFIVMELLRGKSLKQFIEENGAPLAEVAAMMGAALAEALAVAHRAGVIHRDVKPANVMIDGGRLVLCDFGVARLTDDDAVVTQSGAMLGTPAFMSPEQALGRPADARSDVYSVGATIYQIATGHLPASGSTPVVLAAVSRGEFEAPLKRNPTIGPDLSRVILKAMDKDPARRYASAEELREALDGVVKAAGFTEPAAELKEYFAAPGTWNERATARILEATMARAKEALDARQVARALALADRVLAFRPDDAEARALVDSVGHGDRAWRRVRRAALAVAACGLVAASVAAWVKLRSPAPAGAVAVADAGPIVAAALNVGDAGEAAGQAGLGGGQAPGLGGAFPGSARPALVDGGAASGAGASNERGYKEPGRGGMYHVGMTPRAPDAGAGTGTDAGVGPGAGPETGPGAGTGALAHLTLEMRGWCDVMIDSKSHGRARKGQVIDVPPGRHQVVCEQTGTDRSFHATVDLRPGETLALIGTPLAPVDVTLAVAARIDRARHATGAKLRLSPGTYFVEALAGEKVTARAYVTVPTTGCTLKATPELACY